MCSLHQNAFFWCGQVVGGSPVVLPPPSGTVYLGLHGSSGSTWVLRVYLGPPGLLGSAWVLLLRGAPANLCKHFRNTAEAGNPLNSRFRHTSPADSACSACSRCSVAGPGGSACPRARLGNRTRHLDFFFLVPKMQDDEIGLSG